MQLATALPRPGSRIWRNPEAPAAANCLLLTARTHPSVPQIVWHVDGTPFALGDPAQPASWPMQPGGHCFRIGPPLRPERSRPVRVMVE